MKKAVIWELYIWKFNDGDRIQLEMPRKVIGAMQP